ncbi:tyrosine-type recombinase/integrase [Dactylosporangium sp. NPDC005572]|uniref:tyrosine-type recombinase/integrase n=1 Tax=Dactylosporangium sp. NPDC005572 TaxID=3156889 RepID=UPI0033AE6ECF
MPAEPQAQHPDFAVLGDSWDLSLRADGYAANSVRSYRNGVANLAGWLAEHHPDVGPLEVTREHIRGWLIHVREATSSGSARSWFAGVRHFHRWLVTEDERADDPTATVKTPAPNDPQTPVLTGEQIRLLLGTCTGSGFVPRRDAAIIWLFVDGGVRLAEHAALDLEDVDLRDRIVYVAGKGSNRSGPRHRAVPIGVKAAQALDRYIRERRKHPFAGQPHLWLGDRGRARLSADGVDAVVKRRAAQVGLTVHPHMFRHTWASAFRAAGGSEGDLMLLGGWRSRTMLDRYGKAAAADRARESYRKLSYGDRL